MIRVVGTAGHVDHGKSSLVQALTGMNPDRLREEQERQMTIDLGFAWMTLPDGTSVGWVDVPGHRDFIENMLAGVTGIDAALLVVAADEGIMPQTREHLAILDLLEVERLLVAITKVDLVTDPEWLGLVQEDLGRVLAGTRYPEAPIVRVSSTTREGLDELVARLSEMLGQAASRPDYGRPRLPVDRVFTMSGFGTVVTGTLADGRLSSGEEVVILPSGKASRIRGLQTHRRKVQEAVPGSRVAANLGGLDVQEIHRGDVIARSGTYTASRRLDVHIRLLADAVGEIVHQQSLKLHVGTAEAMARVRLLEGAKIGRGERGLAQLELESPVVASRGDRFILRRPSPGATLGGGVVLDAVPLKRYRRSDARAVARLRALEHGGHADLVLEAASRRKGSDVAELARAAGLEEAAIRSVVEALVSDGRLVGLASGGFLDRERWNQWRGRLEESLRAYHLNFPLRSGMPKEELRQRAGVEPWAFASMVSQLTSEGLLREAGGRVALATHNPAPGPDDERKLNDLLARFSASPSAPPSVAECRQALGNELYAFAVETGRLRQLTEEVVFRSEDFRDLAEKIQARLDRGPATVAEIRDELASSRKYVLALVEWLDREGITVREGDERRLVRRRPVT
ncbi:MAG TPA: selenocysteine-specific translation elongation factor [Anaerolineales bacterium]|nr:selenocysteine-specific translation elongation factor [Anaerolineales bacterium]